MAKCKKCGKRVIMAPVYCLECQAEASGWISVEDRLPSDEYFGERVLIYSLVWCGWRVGAVTWWGIPTPEIWDNATHWMPLPEPPGKEG